MKIFIVIALVLSSCTQIQAQAQWDCKTHISYKGQIIIIDKQCELAGYQAESGKQAILKIGPVGRTKVAGALRKGLEWARINSTRNIAFKKLIMEVPAKASVYGPMGHGEYTSVAVVFHATDGKNYTVEILCNGMDSTDAYMSEHYSMGESRSSKTAFDIEKVGAEIIAFSSAAEIQDFLAVLENKPENLDSIFK